MILVDEEDNQLGTIEKVEAHKRALLHRAVSVFIFNSKHEMLLQKRALKKYHSPGLWTNTACTHPFIGESNFEAANRRLAEEMGLYTQLKEVFHFIYKEKLDNEFWEHELDHVFIGLSDEKPNPDATEVMDFKYIAFGDLVTEIHKNQDRYTIWFKKIFERVKDKLDDMYYDLY